MAECDPTVQELISHLRSTFVAEEFQNVAKTLVEREERMKEKFIELEKKAESVEKENDSLFLENTKLNVELKKKKKEFDALSKENLEYKDQIKVLTSEKSRVLKNLEDELKKKQSEIDAERKLNTTITTDLRDRILKLEKIVKDLMSSMGSSSFNLENKQQKSCTTENKKGTQAKSQEIIQIDDDDDEDFQCISTLKRHRVSKEIKQEYNSNFVENIPTENQQRKNLQELHNQPMNSNPISTPCSGITRHLEKLEPRNLMSSLDSDDSNLDPNIRNVDETYKSIIANAKMKIRKDIKRPDH